MATKKRVKDITNQSRKYNKKHDSTIVNSSNNSALLEPSNSDEHPLAIGDFLVVKYRDQSNRAAKIIERNNSNNEWKYYIHYNDFNRRMDEWIAIHRIVSPPSVANPLYKNKRDSYTPVEHVSSPSLPDSTVNTVNGETIVNKNVKTDAIMEMTGPSTVADIDRIHDEHEGLDETQLLEHEELTKVKNIQYVQLGKYVMECWYFSPFPKEYYPGGYAECIFFCEFSMRFFATKKELDRYHQSKPNLPRHPPGNEIYRDENLSMFELDGAVEKIYCQNLCYFAKLFLDHKTLYWDVDPFLFYVLCTRDERGFHPVGYFSKEKYSDAGYNLACILTFPCVQRKGYGKFLISFSYELSKKEEKVGSPEKPLSDLGWVGYRSYWAHTLLNQLRGHKGSEISVMELTAVTSILPEDVVNTLHMLGMWQADDCRNENSNTNIIKSRDGSSSTNAVVTEGVAGNNVAVTGIGKTSYRIFAPFEMIEKLLEKYPAARMRVDADKLHWAPLYVTDPRKDKWSIRSMRDSKEPLVIGDEAAKPSAGRTSKGEAMEAANEVGDGGYKSLSPQSNQLLSNYSTGSNGNISNVKKHSVSEKRARLLAAANKARALKRFRNGGVLPSMLTKAADGTEVKQQLSYGIADSKLPSTEVSNQEPMEDSEHSSLELLQPNQT